MGSGLVKEWHWREKKVHWKIENKVDLLGKWLKSVDLDLYGIKEIEIEICYSVLMICSAIDVNEVLKSR